MRVAGGVKSLWVQLQVLRECKYGPVEKNLTRRPGGSGVAPQMPQAKTAKPEQFIDPSLLQELEKEGFFTELTKRYPNK